MPISPTQYDTLMKPLNGTRIAKRSQGGKQLSYLESWDVRAHLIRIFGFGNFDVEVVETLPVGTREYETPSRQDGDPPKMMVEAIWYAKVRLTIRDNDGQRIARYVEAAVGSTSGPLNMLGEHHDNAVKTAASDALKRCAINLGSQFGLSLYDNGTTREVVKGTIVTPEGWEKPKPTEQQDAALQQSLGKQPTQNGASGEPTGELGPKGPDGYVSVPEAADA